MSASASTPDPRVPADGVLQRGLRLFGDSLDHARAYWYLYTPVFVIWGLAFARVFVDPTPHLPLLFNWTSSLPYTVAVMEYGSPRPLKLGDFIVYAFDGEAQRIYPGLSAPIAETVSPPGFYYVQGMHPNSFDSRYRASGLVRASQVIGKVIPLF